MRKTQDHGLATVFKYPRITEFECTNFEVKFPVSKCAIFRFSKTFKFSSLKAWKFPKLWNSRVFKFRSCKLRKFLTFQFTNFLILHVWNFQLSQLSRNLRNSQTPKLRKPGTLQLRNFKPSPFRKSKCLASEIPKYYTHFANHFQTQPKQEKPSLNIQLPTNSPHAGYRPDEKSYRLNQLTPFFAHVRTSYVDT